MLFAGLSERRHIVLELGARFSLIIECVMFLDIVGKVGRLKLCSTNLDPVRTKHSLMHRRVTNRGRRPLSL